MADQSIVTMIITNKEKTKSYTLLLNKPDLSQIDVGDLVMFNDVYAKHKINVSLSGEMLVSDFVDKKYVPRKSRHQKRLISETYQEYLKKISDINPSNCKWIYNIIDGLSEQDSIFYSDDKFILIPNFSWNCRNIKYFHVLGIAKAKHLHTLRSLTNCDIDLLKHIREKSVEAIFKKYGITFDKLRIYIHYPPSTWHLHIHFASLENPNLSSSVEYSHEISQVIYNLELSSTYYQDYNVLTLDD